MERRRAEAEAGIERRTPGCGVDRRDDVDPDIGSLETMSSCVNVDAGGCNLRRLAMFARVEVEGDPDHSNDDGQCDFYRLCCIFPHVRVDAADCCTLMTSPM